jgi:hypothetical protein
VGIDPGKAGGVARVERHATGYRLLWAHEWTDHQLPTVALSGAVAAVEGLYLGKAGHGVLDVAESAGRWLERLHAAGVVLPLRPMATTWRADLLRLPAATRATDCDRAARACVTSFSGRARSMGTRWMRRAWRCGRWASEGAADDPPPGPYHR